jgi:hypothetical protein
MEWRVVNEFENYEVSNDGQVRNIKTQRLLKPKNDNGYQRVCLMQDSKKIMLCIHRLVASAFLEIPKDDVDHIDGNKSNNQLSNLRWTTHTENMWNQKISKNNKSGVKGVCWNKQNKKWHAHIRVDGINIYLGFFDDIEEARQARITAAQKAFGQFVHPCEKNNP